MLCVTGVYLRDLTGKIFVILHVNVSCLSICCSYFEEGDLINWSYNHGNVESFQRYSLQMLSVGSNCAILVTVVAIFLVLFLMLFHLSDVGGKISFCFVQMIFQTIASFLCFLLFNLCGLYLLSGFYLSSKGRGNSLAVELWVWRQTGDRKPGICSLLDQCCFVNLKQSWLVISCLISWDWIFFSVLVFFCKGIYKIVEAAWFPVVFYFLQGNKEVAGEIVSFLYRIWRWWWRNICKSTWAVAYQACLCHSTHPVQLTWLEMTMLTFTVCEQRERELKSFPQQNPGWHIAPHWALCDAKSHWNMTPCYWHLWCF